MSVLNERLWAVLSERGREATGLTYEEAAGLVRELRADGRPEGRVRGLCIVTSRAAEHVAPAAPAAKASKAKGGGKRAKGRKSVDG